MSSLSFLLLATEWFSRKGGISTFNREFCRALRQSGHVVLCYVPSADREEQEDARCSGIELIQGSILPGATPDSVLYRKPPLGGSAYPDVVVGHDRFTGPAARAQVEDYFKSSLRLHFVHTAPGEIEFFKSRDGEQATSRSEDRENIELDLAETADLVVTVGPLLYSEFKTLFVGRNSRVPIHQINPGIVERQPAAELPPQPRCLVLGRAEDMHLKGMDIAARAIGLVDSKKISGEPILVVRGALQGTGDQLRRTLEDFAASPGIQIRTREYTEKVDRISEDIRRSSLLLMPSRSEGFGLVGLEAISMDVPVLLSQRSGLSQLLIAELKELSHPLIVPITGQLEIDAKEWASRMEAVLGNRLAAFERARIIRRDLSRSLSWEFAVTSLMAAIGETRKMRQRQSKESATGKDRSSSSGSRGFEATRSALLERSLEIRTTAYASFAGAPVKWGPSLFSNNRKVANVCEVLLALDNAFIYKRGAELVDPIEWLLSQQRQGGFPSLSRDLITTHCTALGSLACSRVAEWDQMPAELRQRASRAPRKAAEACLAMAGERGWGTWGRGNVRIQPTIWALRALTHHAGVFGKELFRRLEQLRAMHSAGSPGCFGFKPGTEPRVSPTASFLLLSADLSRIGYKPAGQERYYLETYNAAHYLASTRSEKESWESEVELYYVDPEYVTFVGNVEQLSWFHVSGPLAVEALARNPHLIGRSETEAGWLRRAQALLDRFDSVSGMFQDRVFAEAGLTEPVFPTAYGCMALIALEQWLAIYERIAECAEAPRPEIEGKVINKVAAAIVKDGCLLLVRKFGTDQLIMPGGAVESGETAVGALRRELFEELGIEVDISVDQLIGVYRARAAFEAGVDVEITLYHADLRNTPKAQGEIEELVWHRPGDLRNRLSPIVEEHILPDMKKKAII